MEREIRLGIIGPLWIRQTMEQSLMMFPSISPIYRLSDNLTDAVDFTKELASEVDGYLFSGRIPFTVGRSHIPEGIPAFYIPLKGAGLYQSLYQLKMNHSFTHISFDGIQSNYIERAKSAIGETFSYDVLSTITDINDLEEVIHFHEKIHQCHSQSVAITSLKVVAETLQSNGIHTSWLKPSEDDITVILERILLTMKKRIELESQVVIGRMIIESHSKLAKQYATEQQIQKRNAEVYRLLLARTEEMEAYLTPIGINEYMFVTTRGTFERITEGYKWMPVISEVNHKLAIRLSIGVGFGRSALEAGTHARIALYQALEDESSSCYIVREDRSVFGPVDLIAPLKYPLTVTDTRLLDKAEVAKMNAAHLEKVMAMLKRKRIDIFTAHELADVLGITPRSAHRILLSWLDAEIITVVGTEKISSRGRPRQVFALNDNS